jgi:hypothetical protein
MKWHDFYPYLPEVGIITAENNGDTIPVTKNQIKLETVTSISLPAPFKN